MVAYNTRITNVRFRAACSISSLASSGSPKLATCLVNRMLYVLSLLNAAKPQASVEAKSCLAIAPRRSHAILDPRSSRRLPFGQLHEGGFHVHRLGLKHADAGAGADDMIVQVFDRHLVFVQFDRQTIDLLLDRVDAGN